MSQLNFEGRVAIILGAVNTIGREVAQSLSRRGAKLVLYDTGNTKSSLEELVNQIVKQGGVAKQYYETTPTGNGVVEFAVQAYGNVDILVSSSDHNIQKALDQTTLEELDTLYNNDLRVSFAVLREAWPLFRKNSFGRVVLFGSDIGIFGADNYSAVATVKGAYWGFMRSVALEGEKKNIRTNLVLPHIKDQVTASNIGELVSYLVHPSTEENGNCYEIQTNNKIQVLRYQRNDGLGLPIDFTAELVKANRHVLNDYSNPDYPVGINETAPKVIQNAQNQKDRLEEQQNKLLQATNNNTENVQPTELKSDALFDLIGAYLDSGEGKHLIESVNSVYIFEIKKNKKGPVVKSFVIDLKNHQGKVTVGKVDKPDAIFTMTDDDFDLVCNGKLNPQVAFTQGRMRVKGSMKKATLFRPDIFPAPTPENKAKYIKPKL